MTWSDLLGTKHTYQFLPLLLRQLYGENTAFMNDDVFSKETNFLLKVISSKIQFDNVLFTTGVQWKWKPVFESLSKPKGRGFVADRSHPQCGKDRLRGGRGWKQW